jgi:hypothetical protein
VHPVAPSSSIAPSQSSSIALQDSVAAGLTAAEASLQSPPTVAVYAPDAAQEHRESDETPQWSPSPSRNRTTHPVAPSSSVAPSQSSSRPLQPSVAPGFTVACESSQSFPAGADHGAAAAHRHRVWPGAPAPSPSPSLYQFVHPVAPSSSVAPSQSSSRPLQPSAAPGWTAATASSQSPPTAADQGAAAAHRHFVWPVTPNESPSPSW